MREIKFRGKRVKGTHKGRFVYGALIQSKDKAWIFPDTSKWLHTSEFIEVAPSTVGQFTGLKDKNGQEIYEGDVVKWNQLSNSEATVYWNADELCYACKNIQVPGESWLDKSCEIIDHQTAKQ